MTYAAPLNDMRFVLNRLAGLPEIATLPGFEDADPELVEAILIEAGRFAGEVLAPDFFNCVRHSFPVPSRWVQTATMRLIVAGETGS